MLDFSLKLNPIWLAALLCFGWWLFRFVWYRVFYDLHKIPHPAVIPAFVGLTLALRDGKPRVHDLILNWALECGRLTRLETPFGKTMIFVCDPKTIMTEIQGGKQHLPKSDIHEPIRKILAPKGGAVFESKDYNAKTKEVRRTLAPAFNAESIKKASPVIATTSQTMSRIIQEHQHKGKAFDIQDLCSRWSFDFLGKVAFGVELQSLENGSHPLLDAMMCCTADAMADGTLPLRPTLKTLFPFMPAFRHAAKMLDQLQAGIHELAQVVLSPGDPEEDDQSMGACLRRLRNSEFNFQYHELVAELATLVVAGADAIGHQLGWTLCLLAAHPDIQRKLANELRAAGFGPGGREPEYSDLAELKYLNAVIKESLRFCPASANGTSRVTDKDMTVSGYRLPKGITLVMSGYCLNMAPWLWDEPEVFKPERWESNKGDSDSAGDESKDAEKLGERLSEETKGRLWTFSYGPRDCLGQRLALLQLQMALAILCSMFWFELDPRMGGWADIKRRIYYSLVIACEGGIWLRAKPQLFRSSSFEN